MFKNALELHYERDLNGLDPNELLFGSDSLTLVTERRPRVIVYGPFGVTEYTRYGRSATIHTFKPYASPCCGGGPSAEVVKKLATDALEPVISGLTKKIQLQAKQQAALQREMDSLFFKPIVGEARSFYLLRAEINQENQKKK